MKEVDLFWLTILFIVECPHPVMVFLLPEFQDELAGL